jgi:transposase
VREALSSVIAAIEVLSRQILALDGRIRELGKKKYPETALLRQVGGVGPIVALAYVLTLEHPGRFRKSRAVGPYLGLVPPRSQSGDSDPQLRITKEGDTFLRRLLVQSAQYILGPSAEGCDLRRFRRALSDREQRNAKRRPSSPSHESWPCSCIGCGRAQRSTSCFARPELPGTRP